MLGIDWNTVKDKLHTQFWGNPLWEWAAAVATVFVLWIVLAAIFGFLRRRARKMQDGGKHRYLYLVFDILGRTRSWFLFVAAVYAGTTWLHTLPPAALKWIRGVFVVAAFLQVGFWLSGIAVYFVERVMMQRAKDDPSRLTTLAALNFLGKLLIWSVVLLLMLANLHVDIGPLIAGLGVSGIAVALAAQNILGDLFASLAIVLDRPFEVGDFIIVGDFMGAVERVGMKTTRLRSIGGEQLIFGNTDLLHSRVRNYKRMRERRIVFALGVTYDTPYEKLEKIPSILKETIEAQEGVRFDRAHFKGYGASSLDFEIVYYVLTPDYTRYMDIQQAINLNIYKTFESLGIEFAYPTHTVYLAHGEGEAKAAPVPDATH